MRSIFLVLGVGSGLLFLAAPAAANSIDNGDFSSGLTGWTIPPFSASVTNPGGFALLVDDGISGFAGLQQQFTIPPAAQTLVFTYTLVPSATSSPPSDWFTASLLDPITSVPLLSTPGQEITDYFYHDAGGLIDFDPTIVGLASGTVTLDITSLTAGAGALLVFDLALWDDGSTTEVTVDDVAVTVSSPPGVIPEPVTAACLCMAFAGLGGYLRRRMRA